MNDDGVGHKDDIFDKQVRDTKELTKYGSNAHGLLSPLDLKNPKENMSLVRLPHKEQAVRGCRRGHGGGGGERALPRSGEARKKAAREARQSLDFRHQLPTETDGEPKKFLSGSRLFDSSAKTMCVSCESLTKMVRRELRVAFITALLMQGA